MREVTPDSSDRSPVRATEARAVQTDPSLDANQAINASSPASPTRSPASSPHFDVSVPPGGYHWWYVDGLSDDGRLGLTLIVFIGSVFSPYYAWRRGRRGIVPAWDHCAVNIALYGAEGARWAMTERGRRAVRPDHDHLTIGPSGIAWEDGGLTVTLNERGAPLPKPVRGRLRLEPAGPPGPAYTLEAAGGHIWWPIAPYARLRVELEAPRLSWEGAAYLDSNAGDVPLEASFRRWTWSRAALNDGSTAVLYDVEPREAAPYSLAVRFRTDGRVTPFAPPPEAPLPPGRIWRMPRTTRGDGGEARVVATFEDTPFYTRSVVASTLEGEAVTAVHESLSLERFRAPWVQMLLPFRMPRLSG